MNIERPSGRGSPSKMSVWEVRRPVRLPRPLFLVATDHRLGVGEAVAAILIAQVLLAELAGGGVRKLVDKLDRIRQPPFRDPAGQKISDFGVGDVASFVTDDQQQRALIPFGVGNS